MFYVCNRFNIYKNRKKEKVEKGVGKSIGKRNRKTKSSTAS